MKNENDNLRPPANAPFLKSHAQGVILILKVQPRASRTEIAGVLGTALKIRIAGAPVDGKANAELIHYLSKLLRIPQSGVVLLRGETSKQKEVLITGRTPAEVLAVLQSQL